MRPGKKNTTFKTQEVHPDLGHRASGRVRSFQVKVCERQPSSISRNRDRTLRDSSITEEGLREIEGKETSETG